MSKPRYKWWGYIKAVIRDYPMLMGQYYDLHNVSGVASVTGMPHGSDVSRATENVALRELPLTEQREYEAVKRAVERTGAYNNGAQRLRVIDLVLWTRSHTVAGAAVEIGETEKLAGKWHGDFIRLVAGYYGLMDRR